MIILSSSTIFLIILLVAFWYIAIALRAKEIATDAALKSCEKHNLQFLDDTVTLQQIKVTRRDDHKVVFFRRYEFEYTNTSHQRLRSFIIMHGYEVRQIGLDDETVIYFARSIF